MTRNKKLLDMFLSTRHLEETNIRESIKPSLVSDKSGNMMRRAHEGNKNKKQKGFVAYYLPPDTFSFAAQTFNNYHQSGGE